MILVIAEKPSVARDIARVIGAKESGEGFRRGNGYLVSWAIGHLVSLQEPDELDEKYVRWRKEDLPILPENIPLKILPKTKSQFTLLKKLMNSKEVDSLICATDSGREGELIFRYIYQMAGCKKPFQRLWISSMTDEAIRAGFAALKPSSAYDTLYESARCRSEADWLVGMNASRAFTLHYDALLSIGRVQTPTLAILVKRRREIDQFKPTPYYLVEAKIGSFSGTWFDRALREKEKKGFEKKITKRENAEAIAQKVAGHTAVILSVSKDEKKELPPQLFDLTTLQKEASTIYGFTADKTLKLTQALYENHKLVTYPRTDSRYLSHDMQGSVEKALRGIGSEYAQFTAPLLAQPIPMPKRIFDDTKLTDHHAIIPTGKTPGTNLTVDEGKIFDLIARRLIAAFYPPCITNACTVISECEGECFVSEATTTVDAGFKAVMPPRKSKAAPELPPLNPGESYPLKSAKVLDKSTEPPKEHTDASLLSEMEHAGRSITDEELREQMKGCSLGTPATRAAMIERLIAVNYAKRVGKTIQATEKGCRLIDAVPPEIASPETTGRWEQELEKIARGKGDAQRFLEGIRRLSAFLTDYADTKAPQLAFEKETGRGKGGKKLSRFPVVEGVSCPLCKKGKIQETEKAFGCSEWRNGCRFTLWKNGAEKSGGPILNEGIVKALLKSPNLCIRGSTGILWYAEGRLHFEKKNP